MPRMQIFVPNGTDGTTVEAKVYRCIVEGFEEALPLLQSIGLVEEVQPYRELTSMPVVLEHFRVLKIEKVYAGTIAEWKCTIEAPEEIMQRYKKVQEVIA